MHLSALYRYNTNTK
jgi:hypothetical protein